MRYLMALALCLTLLPTAQAAGEHKHCLCGAAHNSDITTTHKASDLTTFATKLYSAGGKYDWYIQKPNAFNSEKLEFKNNQWVLPAGYYYLDDDNTNTGCTDYTIKIEGDVTICLNGQKIDKTSNAIGPVFEVTNGYTLTLTDCKGGGTGTGTGTGKVTRSDGTGSGVYVNGSTLNLYEGQITGNNGQKQGEYNDRYGGGVYVNNGTFNMYGGAITENDANYGGGVYVKGSTFNMYGGTISNNTSSKGSGSGSGGAGVYVEARGNFIMNDIASVTENTIGLGSNGGGVYVNGGTFTMNNDASVADNKAYNSGICGGGVYVSGGTFEMNNNASVTGNKATGYGATLNGGGVYVLGGGEFTMNGSSKVTKNAAYNNENGKGDGGGVYVSMGSKFEMNGMNGEATSVSNNTATGSGGGVYVGGSLTMNDSAGITGNKAGVYGGGVHMGTSRSTVTMNGKASITGNQVIGSDGKGGGVYVGGTFTVADSPTVTGNTDASNADNNVYLDDTSQYGKSITIGGTLNGNAESIGVTTKTKPSAAKIVIATGSKALNDGDAEKFKSDRDCCEISVDTTNNKQLVLTKIVVPHTHTWKFQKEQGNDSTIYVSCTGEGDCAYKATPATVKISMTKTTYPYSEDMEAPTAQLTHSDNWPEGVAKAQEGDIKYWRSNDSGNSYKIRVTNDNDLKTPGKYLAQLKFNEKWLEAFFSVVDNSMQDPTYTAPTAKTGLVYNGTAQVLINEGSATGGEMQYRLGQTGDYGTDLPTATNAGTYTVWYKVVGDATHNDVAEQSLEVRIEKAKLSGTPTFTKVIEAGKTLKDVTLTKADGWPEGKFEWGNGVLGYLEDKPLVQGKAYSWLYLADNYYAEGTVVPWADPSSPGGGSTPSQPGGGNTGGGSTGGNTGGSTGGSSGSSSSGSSDSNPIIKTETKNNPDGSTTKTETRKDGSVTQTTTGKDGAVSKTETKKDGSSVTENKAADGSTGTIKTDKNGQTEAETTLSGKAIEDAKKNGEAVKAPVEVEASRNSDTAPTVKVELPKGAGETKVEIPVSNVNAGTVAVLVHPDGTEEILKDSIPTEDGIRLTVDGSATVKIVDNSKGFIDIRNHWAEDEIDFVSARGLVNGVSDAIYAPNNSTTRAQLWTILARQNDADLSGGSIWYEKAQLWSKDKGISDGTQPDVDITRAQMVTMLWRAMGQPAATLTNRFADVSADSYYAQAVSWAVENSITIGVGGGRFDPAGTCTRAQVAAFLARHMK